MEPPLKRIRHGTGKVAKLMPADAAPRRGGRQRLYDDRRSHILAGARRLFFVSGFDQVSIRDIERETGYTRGAIYYYFSSKEDVYLAVVADGLTLVRNTLHLAIARNPNAPVAQVGATVEAFARHFEEARPVFDILIRYFFGMRPGHLLPPEAVEVIDTLLEDSIGLLVTMIEDGREAGYFVCKDPRFEVMTIWGLLTTVVQMHDGNPRMRAVQRPAGRLVADLQAHVLRSLGYRA